MEFLLGRWQNRVPTDPNRRIEGRFGKDSTAIPWWVQLPVKFGGNVRDRMPLAS